MLKLRHWMGEIGDFPRFSHFCCRYYTKKRNRRFTLYKKNGKKKDYLIPLPIFFIPNSSNYWWQVGYFSNLWHPVFPGLLVFVEKPTLGII